MELKSEEVAGSDFCGPKFYELLLFEAAQKLSAIYDLNVGQFFVVKGSKDGTFF